MKVDLHVHTRASPDSWIPPRKLASVAKRKGLDGVAITDHFSIDGWKQAEEGAKEIGLPLIFGEEVAVKPEGRKTKGEILGYFMNEFVDGRGKTGLEVVDELREQDAVIILPHPFDRVRHIFPEEELRELARKVDGIEVFNAGTFMPGANSKGEALAEELGLAKTAGSDAHCTWEVGKAYTIAEASDLEEFRKELLAKRTSVHKAHQFPLSRLAPRLAKIKKKLFG
jgi:predicted metal-dependent phosphoesterase TrpH